MAKKKYIKDSKGVTVSVTTDTLGLEKPLLNENYDIDVHNRNMDRIDEDLTPIDDSYIIELFQHDGDISRPRDYYTKEESDEKYATKEEVESNTNLANQALDKANEAFQRGDNVKTQLVDKLISEGADVSTNNSFEELIGSIALGKKWASGTFDREGITREIIGGDRTVFFVDVNNLSFEPSIIVIHTNFNGSQSSDDNIIIYNKSVSDTKFYSGYTAGSVHNFYTINSPINSSFPTWYKGLIKNNGFKFQIGFVFNTTATYINISEHTWIAFE